MGEPTRKSMIILDPETAFLYAVREINQIRDDEYVVSVDFGRYTEGADWQTPNRDQKLAGTMYWSVSFGRSVANRPDRVVIPVRENRIRAGEDKALSALRDFNLRETMARQNQEAAPA